MLIIRCAACKKKLFKYCKKGPGEVLRCHKRRITKQFAAVDNGPHLLCPCGNRIGYDKQTFWKMIRKNFTYTGTKDPR